MRQARAAGQAWPGQARGQVGAGKARVRRNSGEAEGRVRRGSGATRVRNPEWRIVESWMPRPGCHISHYLTISIFNFNHNINHWVPLFFNKNMRQFRVAHEI